MSNSDKKIVIIKLGGAAITNKKGLCEFADPTDFNTILDQIKVAYNSLKEKGHQMILVHGAGSFGHPQATQYKLKQGWSHLTSKGLPHIRQSLQLLNYTIVSKLEERDVPVLGISPIDYIETQDCEKTTSDSFIPMIQRVERYLSLGFVPVLYGDAVLDQVRGCTILSGDVIMYQMTKLISNVSRCIFLTDVEGIYKHDPKMANVADNELIRHVQVEQTEGQEDKPVEEKNNLTVADVTGGMQGKVNWAKKIVLIQKEQPERYIDTIICKYGTTESTKIISFENIKDQSQLNMTIFRVK